MLRVTDQGRGIPDAIKDRLFEPFVTTKAGGSGLGLSIVHRAVEAHHGFVLVDNEVPNGGTRFTVILPKLAGDASRRTPRAAVKHGS
jgi:signal transduction histidine kinase